MFHHGSASLILEQLLRCQFDFRCIPTVGKRFRGCQNAHLVAVVAASHAITVKS